MRKCIIPALIATLAPLAPAQVSVRIEHIATTRHAGDDFSFILTPVGESTPALQNELMVDPVLRIPGNAALTYLRAAMLIGGDTERLVDQTLEETDQSKFDAQAAKIYSQTQDVFTMLEIAARRENCDWGQELREQGWEVELSHLSKLRLLALLVRVRTLQLIHQGDLQEAVKTLRLGYALAHDAGKGGVLVNGLVGVGIEGLMDATLQELMNQPASPNFYWPLVNLPHPIVSFRETMEGERAFQADAFPVLAKARTGDFTADDAAEYLRELARWTHQPTSERALAWTLPSAEMAVEMLQALPSAQKYYAGTRHLPLDKVQKLSPGLVVTTWWFERFQAASDNFYKLIGLPYPEFRRQFALLQRRTADTWQVGDAPTEILFYIALPSLSRAAETFARVDRNVAALIAVEALRTYAAAHGGHLPAHLDLADTPVPPNPRSGKPFDYQLNPDGSAILSDPEPAEFPLRFEIRIAPKDRK